VHGVAGRDLLGLCPKHFGIAQDHIPDERATRLYLIRPFAFILCATSVTVVRPARRS